MTLLRIAFFAFACFSPLLAVSADTQPQGEAGPAATPEPQHSTKEFMLDNGMNVIVREDHRAPIVISQVWYKVGSSYEPPGYTGISHVVEHMMFKGTEALGPGQFSELVSEYGGKENAFTSRDYTGYYQKWDKSRLPLSFELEADRMVNATFPQDEFDKEIKVVQEERRLRVEDNPNAKTWERFMAAAHPASPYANPIAGWMHDLKSIQRDDLVRWYDTWYAPNNAILVVVGDVQPDAVFELAKQHFGPIPRRHLPQKPLAREVDAVGERRVSVKVPAKLPALYMGFNVPTLSTVPEDQAWEVYALRVLAGILSGGDSARLPTRLERGSQIAASANAGYSPFARGDTLFTLTGVPNKVYSVADLEEALWKEVETVKTEPVTQEELDRIQAQIISGVIYQMDSISSQASMIGRFESVGLPWQLSDEYPDRLSQVTAEQVREVAEKYLTRDRLTVATLDPQPI